jgi:hypothetical protein
MNTETQIPPPTPPPPSTALAELTAMRTSHDALKDLPLDAIERSIQWLAATFGIAGGVSPLAGHSQPLQRTKLSAVPAIHEMEFADLPSLFSAARPEVQSDKALVVAYWLQKIKNSEDLDSQQINSELKHLGHGVPNITRALDYLIGARPALLIQTRKDGTAKQARKRYKLTNEGKNRVLSLLAQPQEGAND